MLVTLLKWEIVLPIFPGDNVMWSMLLSYVMTARAGARPFCPHTKTGRVAAMSKQLLKSK